MKRKDWLTMCVVALGVAGITLAFFSPQPVCAKGPAEGSQPKVTIATAQYQNCTVSIKIENNQSPEGKMTLECENPTARMIDFPVTVSWNTQNVVDVRSRVAQPSNTVVQARSLRCIAFPHSTASYDIERPQASTLHEMRQLYVQMGTIVLRGPWISTGMSITQQRPAVLNIAGNRR